MSSFRLLAVAFAAMLSLSACQQKPAAPTEAAKPVVKLEDLRAPTDNNTDGWKKYIEDVMTAGNVVDQRFRRPYVYFVPVGDDDESKRGYQAQLEAAQNAIGRGVQAGSLLCFAGPNPTHTGDLMAEAFKFAGPKSLKGVRVVYIGDTANSDRIKAVAAPSEAEFMFIEMKQ
jgi:hypothetical protein